MTGGINGLPKFARTSMITEARPYLAPRLELANSNAPLMHRHIAWQGRSSGETVAKGRDPKVPVPDMLAIRPSALGRHCPACRSSALALSVAVDGQLAPSTGALSFVHIPQSPSTRHNPERSKRTGINPQVT